jgi:2'-5' RNA ligase
MVPRNIGYPQSTKGSQWSKTASTGATLGGGQVEQFLVEFERVTGMESTRAFVAVELGPAITVPLQRIIQELRSQLAGVRWSSPEQLHMTLKFVGEVDNRTLPALCQAVSAACLETAPFSIQLQGLGAFPVNKPPRVLWVGVESGASQLRTLAERLDQQLSQLGVPRETRRFTPHLTLGRVGRTADATQLQRVIEKVDQRIALRCEIDEVVLMASLKQQGETIYEPIDTIELLD